jgi:hypothetical protein
MYEIIIRILSTIINIIDFNIIYLINFIISKFLSNANTEEYEIISNLFRIIPSIWNIEKSRLIFINLYIYI